MDKLNPRKTYVAETTDGQKCVITEFDTNQPQLRWRITEGFVGCPWLDRIDDKEFYDPQSKTTFTLKQ